MTALADIALDACVSQFGRRVAEYVSDGVARSDAIAIVRMSAEKTLGVEVAGRVKAEWETRYE